MFAAKLCARKRPLLFPVRDNLVCAFLAESGTMRRGTGMGTFTNDIQVFAYLMSTPEVGHALGELCQTLQAERLEIDSSDLRLLDVVLWMHAQGD